MLEGIRERDRLAPLIEMTFRATYVTATKMREEMLEACRADELDELVAGARALQGEMLGGDPHLSTKGRPLAELRWRPEMPDGMAPDKIAEVTGKSRLGDQDGDDMRVRA